MLNPLAVLDFTGFTHSAIGFWFMLEARIPYLDVSVVEIVEMIEQTGGRA